MTKVAIKKPARKPAAKKPVARKPVAKRDPRRLKPMLIDIDADCCAKCRYGLVETSDQVVCRRYPATAAMMMGGQVVSFFPSMKNDGWCGEFNLKVAP